MNMKTITYSRRAAKEMKTLPTQVSERINAKLERYADTGEGDIKALQGQEGYRLRVGDYRVVFTEDMIVIYVIKVAHRGDVYR